MTLRISLATWVFLVHDCDQDIEQNQKAEVLPRDRTHVYVIHCASLIFIANCSVDVASFHHFLWLIEVSFLALVILQYTCPTFS